MNDKKDTFIKESRKRKYETNEKKINEQQTRKRCYNMERNGNCRFGDKCWFDHEKRQQHQGENQIELRLQKKREICYRYSNGNEW